LRKAAPACASDFGLRFSDFLRTSDFGLRISRTAALSLLLLLSLLPASAQTKTNAPTSRAVRPDFTSFKLITDRNIFSPSRTPSRPMRYDTRTSTQTTSRRGDYFTLVGTMEYEKGAFAFFDGTSTDYRKTLKPRDTIAGYKLTEIAQNYVRLTGETNTVEMKLGMQMRHSTEGGWVAVMPTDISVGSSGYSSAYNSSTSRSYSSSRDHSSDGRNSSDNHNGQPGQPGQPGLPSLPSQFGGEGQPIVVMTEDGPTVVMPAGDPTAALGSTNSPTTQTAPAAAGGEDDVLRKLAERRAQEMNR
jgi:hypothetical protein